MSFFNKRNRLVLPICEIACQIYLVAAMFPHERDLDGRRSSIVLEKRGRCPLRVRLRRTGGRIAQRL